MEQAADYYEQNAYQEAVDYLEDHVTGIGWYQNQPDFGSAWYLMGSSFLGLDENEEAANQLLGWDLYDLLVSDDTLPLLVEELKGDDRLARQLFQSAYVDRPQEAILNACGRLGEKEVQRKLLELLDCKPFPHDEIELETDEE